MIAALSMLISMLVPATTALAYTETPNVDDGYVYLSVEVQTLGAGYLYEPVKVPLQAGDSIASVTQRFLGDGNYNASGNGDTFYLSGIKLPKDITPDVPQLILDQTDVDSGPTQAGQMLSEFDYSFMSGWMVSIDNWQIDRSAGSICPLTPPGRCSRTCSSPTYPLLLRAISTQTRSPRMACCITPPSR